MKNASILWLPVLVSGLVEENVMSLDDVVFHMYKMVSNEH